MLQRYFVQQFQDDKCIITNDDRHHIVNVMRLNENDEIICIANGKSALCKIEEITDDSVLASVVKWEDRKTELPIKIAIASGLPKGDKLDWIVQKGTELGAHLFIPFAAKRSIVKWDKKKGAKKRDRLQKIAKEAAEQSYRTYIPEVRQPVSFSEMLDISNQFDYKLVAYEEDAKENERETFYHTLSSINDGESLFFVFGPEGGLTEDEITLLKHNGFKTCSLGPRILRTETAPLYVLAAVSYHTELMR